MRSRKISRRRFMRLAGATLGVTAAAPTLPAMPLSAAPRGASYGVQLAPFSLADVSLGSSLFRANRDRALSYLSFISADRLLHTFRLNYGLSSSVAACGGWEGTASGLRGHSMGHFLVGLCQAYLSTGDAQYKTKADYLVAELKKCQDRATTVGFTAGYLSAFPESHVQNLENLTGAGTNTCWAPLYSIHKTIAGLLDCYQLLGNQTALTMATRIGDWIYARLSRYSQSHRESMWNYMPWNAGEYGGFNESMAKLYTITGSANHLAAAKFFDHARLFTPCANNQDQLSGLHANTQIPKIIGALEIFEATNTASYYAIAVNFWNMVVGAHSYANRGNSKAEYFKDANSIAGQIGDDTTETCNTYNMLKLTRRLFFHDPSQTKYMDYYEQALYNHILGVQNPSASHGFSTYFTPLRAGGIRTYSNDYDSFTCCHSTGNTESQTKFQESIYFFAGETLYVNLFIPSTLSWKARGLTVTQSTSFPEQNTTTLTIGGSGHIALKVRVPSWVQPGWQLKLNGAVQPITATPGSYATLDRTWANGDVVEITMPMALRLEATPDNASLKALFYGPVLLAGAYGSNDLSQTPALDGSSIRTTSTPLQFTTTASGASVSLLPFYKLHGQRYVVYWYASALPAVTATATAVATRTATPATPTTTPATPTATPTAAPTATPVAGAVYQVSYVLNQWGTGFTADVTVKNASASAISGWTLAWTFGGSQQVTSSWNATVAQSGASVTATNVSYNASIPAGGSVSFGFQGSYSGTNSIPSGFTLNGQPCALVN